MTIALEAGQTLHGVADTASAVTYTISGDAAGASDSFQVLAQGQLPDTVAVLGTVPGATSWIIKSILLANATGSIVDDIQLFIGGDDPDNLIVSLLIPAGGSAVYDGAWHIYDASGNQTATSLVVDAANVTSTPAGTLAATNVQDALDELDAEKATTGSVTTVANDLAAHIADAADAHDASAISSVPAGNLAATDVQAALNELDTEKAAASEPIAAAHIADATDAHAGSAITNTPAGNIAATTVQAAINELDSEKQPLDATLSALAGQNWAANSAPVGSGADTVAQIALAANKFLARASTGDYVAKDITDFGLSLADDANAAAGRTTLGLGTVATLNSGVANAGDVPLRSDADARYAARATFPVTIGVALSDETTAITTGTSKCVIRAPFAFTLTAVRASLNTASSSGTPTVDINEAGTTVLSTKLTIDVSELTSTTAAAAAVISDAAIADDAELTFDIDVAGTGAKGLKVWLIGTRVV